jgi:hypothetical protein
MREDPWPVLLLAVVDTMVTGDRDSFRPMMVKGEVVA